MIKLIKNFIHWFFPDHTINEEVINNSTSLSSWDYCKHYCKENGFEYLDWFPKRGGGLIVCYKVKLKGWFSK